jgi:Trk K+ transport system NAD-binding subunit
MAPEFGADEQSNDVESEDPAVRDAVVAPEETVVGDPIEGGIDAASDVIVLGYDAWTEPVLSELSALGIEPAVVVRDATVADRLRNDGFAVVHTEEVDEACFHEAGIESADAVLVATLDDQLNVLAVLTVMNVDASMQVVTFAGEEQDVPKLRAAGADRVVSLGEAVGELLVEVALSEREVDTVLRELVGSRR